VDNSLSDAKIFGNQEQKHGVSGTTLSGDQEQILGVSGTTPSAKYLDHSIFCALPTSLTLLTDLYNTSNSESVPDYPTKETTHLQAQAHHERFRLLERGKPLSQLSQINTAGAG
jgi:hypothetical protein